MNKEKLLAIATLVRSIPQEQLNMEVWHRKNSCRTIGCAVGHAIAAGILPELEIAMSHWENFDGKLCDGQPQPRYRGGEQDARQGFDCIEEVLDLTSEESDYLFTEEAYEGELEDDETEELYITPEQVALRIEAFVVSEGEITS